MAPYPPSRTTCYSYRLRHFQYILSRQHQYSQSFWAPTGALYNRKQHFWFFKANSIQATILTPGQGAVIFFKISWHILTYFTIYNGKNWTKIFTFAYGQGRGSWPPSLTFTVSLTPSPKNQIRSPRHWQKLRIMCFNQQFCTKINYFSSIQCFILMYPPPSFTHEKSHPVSCFCLCESHIIRQETDSESRMIQVSTIVVSLHYSESSEESNR